jgi:hypothetical protein
MAPYFWIMLSLLVAMFFLCVYLFMGGTNAAMRNFFLKEALAYLMKATQEAAVEVEGYTDEQIFAMRRAARELGLKWVQELDENEDTVYRTEPKISEYIENLKKVHRPTPSSPEVGSWAE